MCFYHWDRFFLDLTRKYVDIDFFNISVIIFTKVIP
ncbi:hypothetical protein TKV_c10350 [Thermoanaerobacter kivui]|uniref:Uncharacterized protein n=1 Tax=Thermoanaerobacter kivui TaxID=2325 RepID=A0A097AQW4_THEKI|nr:hypothetical protein TKV_c10350 [Thermoanaerobacter kivui]